MAKMDAAGVVTVAEHDFAPEVLSVILELVRNVTKFGVELVLPSRHPARKRSVPRGWKQCGPHSYRNYDMSNPLAAPNKNITCWHSNDDRPLTLPETIAGTIS